MRDKQRSHELRVFGPLGNIVPSDIEDSMATRTTLLSHIVFGIRNRRERGPVIETKPR